MRARQQGFLPLLPLLGGAWSFLSKIPWWAWAILAAVIFHFWSLHVAVDDAVTGRDQMWEKKEAGLVIQHNQEMAGYKKDSDAKSIAQQIQDGKEKAALAAKLQDALKRIPTHVTKADDARCGALPVGGLRDLSDLATGQISIPGSPSEHVGDSGLQTGSTDHGTGSPVYLSALFASDAKNITKLRACSGEVTKWRTWYKEQRALCILKGLCE